MKVGDWVQCLSSAPTWYRGKIGRVVWVTPKGEVHAQFDDHEVRILAEHVKIVHKS